MSGKHIAKSAVSVSAITMLSRVLGYIRDALSAALFGAGTVSDAFFVAFRIPNLLRDLMAEGALSSAFIPVFTEYKEKKKPDELWKMANNVLTVLTAALILIVIAGIIAAPVIVAIIAPGFAKSPDKFALTVELTRIMFPFIMLISIAAILMGILNSFGKFSAPAFAPVMFNIGIIIFGGLICPLLNEKLQIYVWAAGSLFGALLQLLVQLFPAFKLGLRIKPVFDLDDKGLRKVLSLMLPATVGQSITQISLIINTIIASFLAAGSVTYLYYGNRLMQLPLGVFGVAIATVSFPYISKYVALGENDNLKKTILSSLKQAFFIIIPASVGLMILSREINTVLFMYGKYGIEDVINTAKVSIMYSIGIFAFGGVKILTPVYYALDDAGKAVRIGAEAILINLGLNIIFIFLLPHNIAYIGLALAASISGIYNFFALYKGVCAKTGDIGTHELIFFALKIIAASLIMGAVVYFISKSLESFLIADGLTRKENGFIVLLGIISGIIIYFSSVFILKIPEAEKILILLKKRFSKNPGI